MDIIISKKEGKYKDKVLLIDSKKKLKDILNKTELAIANQIFKNSGIADLSSPKGKRLIVLLDSKNSEKNRKYGASICSKIENASIVDLSSKDSISLQFLEGLLLKDYQFFKYKSKKNNIQKKVQLITSQIKKSQINELRIINEAVFESRDWVNEPVNKLTTKQFIKNIKEFKVLGVDVEVLNKSKLQTLNMGGIIGVNQGSNEDPALIKMEWKPKNAKNKNPVVLVGKGVLFDTGGINIKTGDFMTSMKADMGGAAAVLGALKAIVSCELPIHIIVLTPVTENRINGNELVPGDVIKMHNGKTVEVLNTDAEGRLILADALSFAEKFNPSLVIDVATLTGSAYRITGHHGAIVMGTDTKNIKSLKLEGELNYERLVELPMWEEFDDELKSDVADINNLGSTEGQAVCAGFFLKKFVNYPWIHLDIAGSAFRSNNNAYIPKGGTGFGVRLLYHFLKNNFAK